MGTHSEAVADSGFTKDPKKEQFKEDVQGQGPTFNFDFLGTLSSHIFHVGNQLEFQFAWEYLLNHKHSL